MQVDVYDPHIQRVIAQFHLNGHSIAAGGPLGQSGAMQSFTMIQGTIETQWEVQQPLILQRVDGTEAKVRIAALPVEEGEIGYIEFL